MSAARQARQAFDDAGYTLDALTERLGPHVFAHLAAGELAPLRRATRLGDRLDVLARLFLVGAPVRAAAARAALAPLPLDEWQAGGLVGSNGDEVVGRLVVRPLGGDPERLVVHDRREPSAALPVDHVVGVSASSLSLAGATIRRSIDAALDVGTGCGIQALHAAEHSRRVVASDLNPRAVACAELTMQLNDLSTVTVLQGDLFEPVDDGRFDLIVANPPFVVSPSRRYLFRDGDGPLDEVSRRVVRATAEHLRPEGHGQLLASWAHVDGEDWRERLADWFAGTGCDALVLEREELEPAAHASSWLRQTGHPEDWDEYDAWMEYYDAHRVEAIGVGLITMRRRAEGRPWLRAETASQDFAMPCGDHLGATFELADLLDASDDRALLDVVFEVPPDVVLDERRAVGSDGWVAVGRRLRQTAGLCYEGDIDETVAQIISRCDGRRPLGAALAEESIDDAMPVIRRLVEKAFLLPVVGSR